MARVDFTGGVKSGRALSSALHTAILRCLGQRFQPRGEREAWRGDSQGSSDAPALASVPMWPLRAPTPAPTFRERDELLSMAAPIRVRGDGEQPRAYELPVFNAESVDRCLTATPQARTHQARVAGFIEPDRWGHLGLAAPAGQRSAPRRNSSALFPPPVAG
jgi:hypothetical protein